MANAPRSPLPRRNAGAAMFSNPNRVTPAIVAFAALALLLLAFRSGPATPGAILPVALPDQDQQQAIDITFPVYSKILSPRREVWNGTELVYQVPANPRAVMFLAHGCYCKATFFWDKHPDCSGCSGAPEERAFVIQALQASYAVIAVSSQQDCWRKEDAPRVKLVLESWMDKLGLVELPLLGLGASSGGYFVSSLARDVKFDAIVLMIAEGSFQEVPSLPYPPVLFVHMVKDEVRAERIREIMPVLRKAGIEADEIQCEEVEITDDFFMRRIPYVDLEMSENLVGVLQRHGHLDFRGYLKSDSRSLNLKQDMSGGLGGQELLDSLSSRNDHWAHHIQEELNLAYGNHEFTSLSTTKIITWLESHVKMPPNITAGGQS
ncbi:hypothetical protein KC19_4G160800 [Ceratodon purpureus]|uniref:Uncharacterized protein n=1 Tax=Ceratodon purpureus TaxID=3225 RepID=A0A8T0IBD9_CERPU|nr:hypothetical protein KC19_4G160800 [Ceratodon purpureus]